MASSVSKWSKFGFDTDAWTDADNDPVGEFLLNPTVIRKLGGNLTDHLSRFSVDSGSLLVELGTTLTGREEGLPAVRVGDKIRIDSTRAMEDGIYYIEEIVDATSFKVALPAGHSGSGAGLGVVFFGEESSGIRAIMRRECHIWLDDTDEILTEVIDWPITTDFNIVLNSTKIDLANTIGTCTVNVKGSVDGLNYGNMTDTPLGTTTLDNAIIVYNYDFHANGALPFMKIGITPASDVDNTALPIKVNIIGA